jgi:hypothetical protein
MEQRRKKESKKFREIKKKNTNFVKDKGINGIG